MVSEFKELEKAGIEINYNVRVGKDPSVDDLLKKHAAVLISVGASKGVKLKLEGGQFNQERVYDAVKFMQRVNTYAPARVGEVRSYKKLVDVNVGNKAVVIGAGPVAIDTSRTLVRLGVDDLTCACLESEDNIPVTSKRRTSGFFVLNPFRYGHRAIIVRRSYFFIRINPIMW